MSISRGPLSWSLVSLAGGISQSGTVSAGRMTQEVLLSGMGASEHRASLTALLVGAQPAVVGIAAAFVSVEGIRQTLEILRQCGQPRCRLVAGIDYAITHPEALYAARAEGWAVRFGRAVAGIFHPKLVLGGSAFGSNGTIQNLSCVYVGSSNLTDGGFRRNIECGLLADGDGCVVSASAVFAALWNAATPANAAALRHYAARFAERSRQRAVSELAAMGVTDSRPVISDPNELRTQQPPRLAALAADFAVAAWAGLQSFTGEYRFQIEFPRDAGKVISDLIGSRIQPDGGVDVYCPADGTTRRMQYRFYAANSMFRLNVPNDVPGVSWARAHREGLAVVEQGPPGGGPLRLRILTPGAESGDIVARSAALGTWGRTTTRSYGWF